MKTVQQQMEEFKQLSLEEKKGIVFDVLEGIKEVNEDTRYIYQTLPTLNSIDDGLLDIIYQNIAEVAEKIRQGLKVDAIQNIDLIRQKIEKIREKEATERAQENPEDLLKNL